MTLTKRRWITLLTALALVMLAAALAFQLALPALDERVAVSMQATLEGPQRNGSLSLDGDVTPATRDADLALKVKGLDLVALQPYLLRSNEGAVKPLPLKGAEARGSKPTCVGLDGPRNRRVSRRCGLQGTPAAGPSPIRGVCLDRPRLSCVAGGARRNGPLR